MQLHVVNPQDRLPSIFPLEFWVEYIPQKDGSVKEQERVKWTRKGQMGAVTEEAVFRLQKDNGAIWQALKPYYDHWKQGKEAPIDGTPLAAWPGATPQLVKALEGFHIRSVDDLAGLDDGAMAKVQVPGIRGFREKARAYRDACNATAPIAGELDGLRNENANLKRELEELRGLVQSISDDKRRRKTSD